MCITPVLVRAITDIHKSHSRTPCNSKLTQMLWNLPHVQAQSHAIKYYLAAAGDMCGKDRTSPILCGIQPFYSQSQLEHQPVRTSDKMTSVQRLSIEKWRDELPCIKSQKSSRIYISMHNIEYTPPWIFQPSQSLRQWERAGMISVRLWVKIHLHHRLAVA